MFGIKFAAIHPDFAYLMYPARWFPVNDYTIDRFASDIKVTVPEGYRVVAPGSGTDANRARLQECDHERYKFDAGLLSRAASRW